MASVAIRSRPALFSLEDRLADMGSVYVRRLAGYYWSTAFDDIDGPFDTLEKVEHGVGPLLVRRLRFRA